MTIPRDYLQGPERKVEANDGQGVVARCIGFAPGDILLRVNLDLAQFVKDEAPLEVANYKYTC